MSGWIGDVLSSFSARDLAGFLIGRGEMSRADALAAPTLGSLLGALVVAAGLPIGWEWRRGG